MKETLQILSGSDKTTFCKNETKFQIFWIAMNSRFWNFTWMTVCINSATSVATITPNKTQPHYSEHGCSWYPSSETFFWIASLCSLYMKCKAKLETLTTRFPTWFKLMTFAPKHSGSKLSEHSLQSQISIIAAYVCETVIHFLQFYT